MILTGRNVIALGVVILVACLSGVQAEVKFEKRNSFSLGPNVITAKFSPDYTLLAVLRSG